MTAPFAVRVRVLALLDEELAAGQDFAVQVEACLP
jgi:hypothetical protein